MSTESRDQRNDLWTSGRGAKVQDAEFPSTYFYVDENVEEEYFFTLKKIGNDKRGFCLSEITFLGPLNWESGRAMTIEQFVQMYKDIQQFALKREVYVTPVFDTQELFQGVAVEETLERLNKELGLDLRPTESAMVG